MKNSNQAVVKQKAGCGCQSHGGRHLFMGIVLFAIGAAFKYGYSSSDVLMLVGALFVAKGIHVMLAKKKCER